MFKGDGADTRKSFTDSSQSAIRHAAFSQRLPAPFDAGDVGLLLSSWFPAPCVTRASADGRERGGGIGEKLKRQPDSPRRRRRVARVKRRFDLFRAGFSCKRPDSQRQIFAVITLAGSKRVLCSALLLRVFDRHNGRTRRSTVDIQDDGTVRQHRPKDSVVTSQARITSSRSRARPRQATWSSRATVRRPPFSAAKASQISAKISSPRRAARSFRNPSATAAALVMLGRAASNTRQRSARACQ